MDASATSGMLVTPMDLAVVMPVYNEEANIEAVVREWEEELTRLGVGYRIFCVNDGSRDGTGGVLGNLAARESSRLVIIDQPNSGHGLACRRGYDQAVRDACEWVLQIDSDGQCDPRFFASFWQARANADCVFGLRTSRDDGRARAFLSAACRLVASALCGVDLKDANVPFRLIRTTVLTRALERIPPDFEMQNVALTMTLKKEGALHWKYVPIHFRQRQGGTNSLNLRRVVSMGWRLLRTMNRVGKTARI